MDDEAISTFCSFTSATPQQAQQYLALTEGNVEQAVELFFTSPDLGNAPSTNAQTQPQASRDDPITIDDDDDDDEATRGLDDESAGFGGVAGGHSVEDDEAMARRLQEEMYGGGGRGAGGSGGSGMDEDDVRAPMARTTETLVGPGSWQDDPNQMRAAVAEQLMARERRRAAPGIFNQRNTRSIWTDDEAVADPEARREVLSRATGGASEQTSKSTLLAELFRPPFDLISTLPWSEARDEGKEEEKWILVNVQDPSIFDCQVLNRDIWKNASIRDTIKEHFLFLQYNKDDPRGQDYVNYYFSTMRDHEDAYPHIAIIDPRTGEQVKTWSGSPGPKASDFLMDLHEFLDRYSLKMEKKNPVQAKRKERKKDVAQMSEEEMLEMAMQNSLDNGASGASKDVDPDALTKLNGKGKAPAVDPEDMDTTDFGPVPTNGTTEPSTSATSPPKDTPFSRISSTNPHEEPTSTAPTETTRIQFRYSGGRVVRRFLLSDPVRRLYEWLKASPLEDKEGQDFELISMGKNLVDALDTTVADAGLKNGTIMVEFLEDE